MMNNAVIFGYGKLTVNGVDYGLTMPQEGEPSMRIDGAPFDLKEPELLDELLYALREETVGGMTIVDERGKELTLAMSTAIVDSVAA